jgi:hypothetical protein
LFFIVFIFEFRHEFNRFLYCLRVSGILRHPLSFTIISVYLQHKILVLTKIIVIMTPSELAKLVRETLLEKSNKKVVFTSFCNALGSDLLQFINHCQKQVEVQKAKRIAALEAELKELKESQ